MKDKFELIQELEIVDFAQSVKVTNKRRKLYYIEGKDRIPQKYKNDNYSFDRKGRLYHIESGELMIRNSRSYFKPRERQINGQLLYSSAITRAARNIYIRKIHEYLAPFLEQFKKLNDSSKYPLMMELLFYVHNKGTHTIDNDNRWIWRKCIQDTLTELGKWSDDNNNIISRNEEETIFIPDSEKERLVIKIFGRKNEQDSNN